jgi:hypothetical protein
MNIFLYCAIEVSKLLHKMKSNALVPKLGKKRDNRDRREDEGGEGAIYGILISHVVSYRQKYT